MSSDPSPYAVCPCGSGQQFKWCCQLIYAGIRHALEQEEIGQHDAAVRLIDQVVARHPDRPHAWGHKARLLFAAGQPDQADEALEKAFALQPSYPFGLWLRASMRYAEGEVQGALLLARKAAESYHPQANDLAQVNYMIFDCEMRRNRPVAARAALEQVLRLQPDAEDVRQTFAALFESAAGRLPHCARKQYATRPAPAARRPAWDNALAGVVPRLADLARAYERLTQEDGGDAAAWFNLGLVRAWLGDNPAALEALDRYIERSDDEAGVVEAVTLGEVLRCGLGLEDQCDYHTYSFTHQIRDPQAVQRLIHEWNDGRRLVPIPNEQEGVLTALVLELTTSGLVTVGRPAAEVGRLAGYLLVAGPALRVSSPLKEPFDRLRDEVRQKLALGLTELPERRGPAQFHDVVAEALVFPLSAASDEKAAERVLEHATRFYEETWPGRPLRSLSQLTPADAASHPRTRRKVLGVIQFLQDCTRGGSPAEYDFDRLRGKLGLTGPRPAAAGAAVDVAALDAAGLAAVATEALSDEQLEQAYQAAHRLNDPELAARFAGGLTARPVQPGRPDRYPYFSFLIQKALREGAHDAALDHVNEGERLDCEHNEGKRRNDYELRRAQILVKRGAADEAEDVYRRLIERTPRNFDVRTQAAKSMLDLKQPARALKLAEEGLTVARQAGERDAEQHLLELAEAARKRLG